MRGYISIKTHSKLNTVTRSIELGVWSGTRQLLFQLSDLPYVRRALRASCRIISRAILPVNELLVGYAPRSVVSFGRVTGRL